MSDITNTNVIAGAFAGQRKNDGIPSNGTSCVQTLTIGGTPSGGTFRVATPAGKYSVPISWTATDADLVAAIQAALDAIVGSSETLVAAGTLSSGIGTVTITFQNNSGSKLIPVFTVESSLTGTSPTLAIAITTAGVTATHRGAPSGATCEDATNGEMYINNGTAMNPVWDILVRG